MPRTIRRTRSWSSSHSGSDTRSALESIALLGLGGSSWLRQSLACDVYEVTASTPRRCTAPLGQFMRAEHEVAVLPHRAAIHRAEWRSSGPKESCEHRNAAKGGDRAPILGR